MNEFQKLKISLRYFLLGKEYFRAVEALEFNEHYHNGTRKDGVTPEFQHQIEIAHYVRSLLPSLTHPEDTIISVLSHDVTEDHGVLISVIREKFGDRVAEAVNLLDKNGKNLEDYFNCISQNEIASIVKGADRMHNIQTMGGVFTLEKQQRYLTEVEVYFLKMLKIARRKFPRQEMAYENIKHVLISQMELIQAGMNLKKDILDE